MRAARCYSPPEHLPDTPAPWPRFRLYGGLAAAVKFYRRRHDHPRDTAVAGRLSAALSWLTNGFMLTFGSFLLAAGVTADAIDRKRIFIAGAALFCLSSLLFCLTHNLFLSGVLRALQGLAAAMILASGSAALAQLYDGAQRTRAFSILGTVFGVGGVWPAADRLHDRRGGLARRIRPVCAALGDSSAYRSGVSASGRKKRAADTRQPGPNPVYAGPDAVYCIAYGHSGPRFFIPDHAGLAHRVGGCSWRLSYAAGG